MTTLRITSSIGLSQLVAAAAAALACAPLLAQTTDVGQPAASHGGTVRVIPPRPVADGEDPLNQKVAAETVDGIVVTVTIDGPTVTLESAVPARVPKRLARANRDTGENFVRATAMAGGQAVSTTLLPDVVDNASEGGGLVRLTRRQVSVVLAADRPIDSVRIEAPATAASGTVDVRGAYARLCEMDRGSKWCPRR